MGEATARFLIERGAKMVLDARNQDRPRRLADEITARGGSPTCVPVNVRRRGVVAMLAQHAVTTFGHLDDFVAKASAMPIVRGQD